MTKNVEIIQITPCFNNGHIHIFEVNVKVCWDKNTFHVELKIEHKFTMSAKGNLMARANNHRPKKIKIAYVFYLDITSKHFTISNIQFFIAATEVL